MPEVTADSLVAVYNCLKRRESLSENCSAFLEPPPLSKDMGLNKSLSQIFWEKTNPSRRKKINSTGAEGGSRFRVSAHKTLRLPPNRHQKKFFAACICRVTFKHLSKPGRGVPRFYLGQLLKWPPPSPLCAQLWHSVGVGGVTEFVCLFEILIFWWVTSPWKISEVYDNPFWDFSNNGESEWNTT